MGQNHTQRRKSDGTKPYTEKEERWDKIIHRGGRAMGQNHTQRRNSDGRKSYTEEEERWEKIIHRERRAMDQNRAVRKGVQTETDRKWALKDYMVLERSASEEWKSKPYLNLHHFIGPFRWH